MGSRLALTSWRAVLEALHIGLQQAGEVASAADILQLCGLADRMDADAFLPLTSEELTSDLGRRIVQFCDLVDYAVQRLVNDELANTQNCFAAGGRPGWWGRAFNMHQAYCLLHFSPQAWAQHGVPLWLKVCGIDRQPSAVINEALRQLGTKSPPRLVVDASGAAYVPVRLPAGVDRDKVLDAMLMQLHEVADLLGKIKKPGETIPPSH
jgi:hypothetical protein